MAERQPEQTRIVESSLHAPHPGEAGRARPPLSRGNLYCSPLPAAFQERGQSHEGAPNGEQAAVFYRADLERALARVAHKKLASRAYRAMLRAVADYGGASLATPSSQVKVWSDLHLGHTKIIDYAQRPFDDANDMARQLWSNWDAAVGPGDTVVCVGDLAMSPALNEATWARLRAAPGRAKVLVIGNHDLTGKGQLRVKGFDEVRAVLVSGQNLPLIWTHYPLIEVPRGVVNVHGHTHGTPAGRSRHINVSVEQLDYRPIALSRLEALARRLVVGEYPPGSTTLERVLCIENK